MKRNLKKIFISLSRLIMPIFYDKKYLKGRWFDHSPKGWRWCWRNLFMQKIIGYNRKVPFPVSHRNIVGNPRNLIFSPNDLNNFQNYGCYFQNYEGQITLGEGTYIAPNVGLITQNHDIHDLDSHVKAKNINIGSGCWVGMNSMILPGIILGDNTVVGAGSIVTKSFPEGNCVIAGNPARILRKLD
ncbi:transferase hexapeptide (six repeat-containing protein) [Terribacillus saccharophilus]|uniref:Transferase hexapeptide (Six repeat-containing protein) n=1 Tax=Terribacillus saccharophilus TaxID=361277 RepID=A0AAX2EFJ5_9BACI|nr:transferase hexapeptide (six repeat-containing protein) [Terribacillus saccharophilus]